LLHFLPTQKILLLDIESRTPSKMKSGKVRPKLIFQNQIMESYVGIVRSNTRLTRAWNRLDILYEETESLFKRSKASKELCELRNMINVGYLITRQAMERKESRGLHYTIDYPPLKKD